MPEDFSTKIITSIQLCGQRFEYLCLFTGRKRMTKHAYITLNYVSNGFNIGGSTDTHHCQMVHIGPVNNFLS